MTFAWPRRYNSYRRWNVGKDKSLKPKMSKYILQHRFDDRYSSFRSVIKKNPRNSDFLQIQQNIKSDRCQLFASGLGLIRNGVFNFSRNTIIASSLAVAERVLPRTGDGQILRYSILGNHLLMDTAFHPCQFSVGNTFKGIVQQIQIGIEVVF